MRNGATNTQRARAAERRRRAVDLRLAGVDPVTAARSLRYGRWTREDGVTPVGPGEPEYDTDVCLTGDRTLAASICRDVKIALDERRAALDRSADAMIAEMTDRAERLRAAVWAKALQGSPAHVREARAQDERIARLRGLDKPVRHEISADAASAQVAAAVAELLALMPPAPAPGLRAIGDPT